MTLKSFDKYQQATAQHPFDLQLHEKIVAATGIPLTQWRFVTSEDYTGMNDQMEYVGDPELNPEGWEYEVTEEISGIENRKDLGTYRWSSEDGTESTGSDDYQIWLYETAKYFVAYVDTDITVYYVAKKVEKSV